MLISPRSVIVLGGTGFLGRRVVRRLQQRGWGIRIGTRSPGRPVPEEWAPDMVHVAADPADMSGLARAVSGAEWVINCIGYYNETRQQSFRDVHVDGARRIARLVQQTPGQRLIHISGIGASLHSSSAYVRSRAEGEVAVRSVCPDAVVLRPSVMFCQNGVFFGPLRKIAERLPVIPLFGRGRTRLQPVWVEDVAEAVACVLDGPRTRRKVYELGGPDVFAYRDILERLAAHTGRRRLLLPVPFAVWRIAAVLLSVLPQPPVTAAQVALMRHDNTAAEASPGFADLGITPQSAIAMGLL